nr:hypothetical protein [Tanacetum cinerariifolium]
MHLGLVLELLKKEKLYAKFSKCEFWLREVQFLGSVINGDGIHVDPSKIKAIKNWKAPRTSFEEEAFNEYAGLQRGIDEMFKLRSDEALYYLDQIWVPLKGDVRTLIIDKAYKSKYSVHPGADKMYYDLRDRYWWSGMKKDIAEYQPEILEWKWERIAMDFVTKLPRTSSGHTIIWVIVDRLTKYAHFLPMPEDFKMDRLASVRCASFKALYGRKCRSLILWEKVEEGQLIRPKLVQETIEKISQIKDRLKVVRDRQTSYAAKRRKPLKFSVGDFVLLKVSPWKGVVHFEKNGKLEPRFVGPFEIIEKVGLVAYRLDFPEELNGVHDTFYVSNLKKCLADPTMQVPLDEI